MPASRFNLADRIVLVLPQRLVSFAGFSLLSVISASAANVMPSPNRFPSAYLHSVLERDMSVRQTSGPTCIIGDRVPARERWWVAHLQARLFPPLLADCRWDAAVPMPSEAPLLPRA